MRDLIPLTRSVRFLSNIRSRFPFTFCSAILYSHLSEIKIEIINIYLQSTATYGPLQSQQTDFLNKYSRYFNPQLFSSMISSCQFYDLIAKIALNIQFSLFESFSQTESVHNVHKISTLVNSYMGGYIHFLKFFKNILLKYSFII